MTDSEFEALAVKAYEDNKEWFSVREYRPLPSNRTILGSDKYTPLISLSHMSTEDRIIWTAIMTMDDHNIYLDMDDINTQFTKVFDIAIAEIDVVFKSFEKLKEDYIRERDELASK